MKLQTTRFGELDVDPTEEITFPRGLLGFPDRTRFLLLPSSAEGEKPAGEAHQFCWLQIDRRRRPRLRRHRPAPARAQLPRARRPRQLAAIGLEGGAAAAEAVQVFVIVNKRGNTLTGNLQGPLIVNTHTRVAEQFVLSDKRFGTHVPLMNLKAAEAAEPAAVITTIGAPASMSA